MIRLPGDLMQMNDGPGGDYTSPMLPPVISSDPVPVLPPVISSDPLPGYQPGQILPSDTDTSDTPQQPYTFGRRFTPPSVGYSPPGIATIAPPEPSPTASPIQTPPMIECLWGDPYLGTDGQWHCPSTPDPAPASSTTPPNGVPGYSPLVVDVTGRVVDPNGDGIPGASVTVSDVHNASATVATDGDGNFDAKVGVGGPFVLQVTADGYNFAAQTVIVLDPVSGLRFVGTFVKPPQRYLGPPVRVVPDPAPPVTLPSLVPDDPFLAGPATYDDTPQFYPTTPPMLNIFSQPSDSFDASPLTVDSFDPAPPVPAGVTTELGTTPGVVVPFIADPSFVATGPPVSNTPISMQHPLTAGGPPVGAAPPIIDVLGTPSNDITAVNDPVPQTLPVVNLFDPLPAAVASPAASDTPSPVIDILNGGTVTTTTPLATTTTTTTPDPSATAGSGTTPTTTTSDPAATPAGANTPATGVLAKIENTVKNLSPLEMGAIGVAALLLLSGSSSSSSPAKRGKPSGGFLG